MLQKNVTISFLKMVARNKSQVADGEYSLPSP